MSVSTVQLKPTPTLAHKIEQLNTVYKQLSSSSSSSTFSPTSQPGPTSSSYSVSVSRVSQGEFTRTDITKLRSTLMTSLPPSKPAPKTTEKITTHQTHVSKEKQASMKLFHFILSFQIVRQGRWHFSHAPKHNLIFPSPYSFFMFPFFFHFISSHALSTFLFLDVHLFQPIS